MKNKLSVEVAIPALNEGRTVSRLVRNLLKQEQDSYILSKITVYSDGSTDDTVSQIQAIQDSRVALVQGKKRLGKYRRLNQAYANTTADIIVVFDADVIPVNDKVLEHLVKPFNRVKNLGLVGGNPQPLKALTLVESAVNSMFKSRELFKSIKYNGHNVHGLWGCCLALSKEFAHKLRLPQDVPDDAFTYFANKSLGYGFRHASKARVWFRSPQTMDDQINQGIRFSKTGMTLQLYFDANMIADEYAVPFKVKLVSLFDQLLRNPLGYVIMKYMHFQVMKADLQDYHPYWEQVSSTKELQLSSNQS